MATPHANPSDCTLAILAGGEGSRMGWPKGLLVVRGQPILAYLLDRMRWPGPRMLVTAPGRERPPGWERFGREVVDPVAGQGPLRGVLTALESMGTETIVVATVDMPEIGAAQLEWLFGQLAAQPAALGVMCLGPAGRVEPFPIALRRKALHLIGAQLAEGNGSVHALAQTGDVTVVPCAAQWPQNVWTNLNRPEDLERWNGRVR
jgi:molybdenum cofactor guanylyltransferase